MAPILWLATQAEGLDCSRLPQVSVPLPCQNVRPELRQSVRLCGSAPTCALSHGTTGKPVENRSCQAGFRIISKEAPEVPM